MTISRNAFKSLVESVQEATAAPSVTVSTSGKGKVRSSGRSSVTDIMQGISNGTINWGDASIGGAMNAAELSQWLAGQMGSGKPSVGVTPTVDAPDAVSGSGSNFGTTTGGGKTKKPSSGKPGLSTSAGTESGVVGSRGRNPMTSTSTGGPRKTQFDMAIRPPETSPTSSGASSTSSGKSSKSSKPKTKSRTVFGTAGGATSRSGGAASRVTATRTVADSVDLSDLVDALSMIVEANRPYINTGGVVGGMGGGVSSVGLGEDFDILDEILAEGLELYGEDGLAEILADFAETGEISQELADLLNA